MRVTIAKMCAVGALAAVALAGCGDDDKDSAKSKDSSSDSSLSEADLKGALLTTKDLDGYTVTDLDDSDDESEKVAETTDQTCTDAFDDSDDPGFLGDFDLEAERTFAQSQMGPFVMQLLTAAPSVSKAGKGFDELPAMIEQCESWTETDSAGAKTEYGLAEADAPSVGDESTAFLFTTTDSDGLTITAHAVVFRIDNLVSIVMGLSASGEFDTDELGAYVAAAEKKVDALTEK